MTYVIDTSVEIKTYVQEQESAKAVRLRNEYHQGVHRLTAPDIFPTEMCNVPACRPQMFLDEKPKGRNRSIEATENFP